ncbi:MAG: response regulator [Opitutaceae bacterium]|jgi:DNA-binding NarL/FixJ family response regulator
MAIPGSVLIVDDEAHVRAFMKLVLEKLGIPTIYEAGRMDEAREKFAAHSPGLVTLDVNLPGGSGLDLLREFRAVDDDVLIVIVSTEVQAGVVNEAADAGADGFIRKDLPRDQILAELKGILAD